MPCHPHSSRPLFFFFNDTATTEIYTLSLHDALPICRDDVDGWYRSRYTVPSIVVSADRKSTRLNSSHRCISYAVFCLKKKTLLAALAGSHRLRRLAHALRDRDRQL